MKTGKVYRIKGKKYIVMEGLSVDVMPVRRNHGGHALQVLKGQKAMFYYVSQKHADDVLSKELV